MRFFFFSMLDAIAAGEGKIGFALRVPIGVVGAIAPFNFPLNLVVHKVGPAIAAGCPVVLKPASQTPFSSIALADMLVTDCGLPAEYLQVVTGSGSVVGNALVDQGMMLGLQFGVVVVVCGDLVLVLVHILLQPLTHGLFASFVSRQVPFAPGVRFHLAEDGIFFVLQLR